MIFNAISVNQIYIFPSNKTFFMIFFRPKMSFMSVLTCKHASCSLLTRVCINKWHVSHNKCVWMPYLCFFFFYYPNITSVAQAFQLKVWIHNNKRTADCVYTFTCVSQWPQPCPFCWSISDLTVTAALRNLAAVSQHSKDAKERCIVAPSQSSCF